VPATGLPTTGVSHFAPVYKMAAPKAGTAAVVGAPGTIVKVVSDLFLVKASTAALLAATGTVPLLLFEYSVAAANIWLASLRV
jgi:hypothetical protein